MAHQKIHTSDSEPRYYEKLGNGLDIHDGNSQEVIIHYTALQQLLDVIPVTSHPYLFKTIQALSLTVPDRLIPILAKLPSVNLIESKPSLRLYLQDSTPHLGMPALWDQGYIGSNQLSVAVLDTGIDFTHPAFRNRVIASYNAINNNKTAGVDNIGHGTHVTGIAAGAYQIPKSGIYSESYRGSIPSACQSNGCPIDLNYVLKDIPDNFSVSITMDWGDKGEDFPGSQAGFVIFDPVSITRACDNCEVTSNSGYISEDLTLPAGTYYVGTLNRQDGEGQYYESNIKYNHRSEIQNHPDFSGVAYGSNIVSVKVMDGIDNGDVDVFDRAIDWVINHRQVYNITVVNLSLGLGEYNYALDRMMAKLADNGILPVVAAGNSGVTSGGIFSPASAPEALTVGAMNALGEVTSYTSLGSSTVNKMVSKPDVLAPGGSFAAKALGFTTAYDLGYNLIVAPDANIGYNLAKDDLIGYQGTSMASPHIAGLATVLASEMVQNHTWDWNSRSTVMDLKRMILAGTYEVANIGYGREQAPNEVNQVYPTLDHNSKDYNEGWGGVDARAVQGLYSKKIELGYSESVDFDLQHPKSQKTHGWRMTLEPGINYGFAINVPDEVNLDLKLLRAENGPTYNKTDYGDLDILAYSEGGLGENEIIGYAVDQPTDVFITAAIVDGNQSVSTDFHVVQVSEIPTINITSPQDGVVQKPPITIEFEGSRTTAKLYIDNSYRADIQSGYEISSLSAGEHVLKVEITVESGITARDTVSITVPATSNKNNLSFISYSSVSILILLVILPKVSRKFDR